MSSLAKDLGELSSLDRLKTTRLRHAARSVLAAIEAEPGLVDPVAVAQQTVLPLSSVLGAVIELESAGLVRVERQKGSHRMLVGSIAQR